MPPVHIPIRPNRTLINAKFEGYKLSFLEESRQRHISIDTSPSGVVAPKVSARTKLSFREIQSRIRHNHLYPSWQGYRSNPQAAVDHLQDSKDGTLFVLDAEYMLIALHYEKTSKRLRSRKLVQIPKPETPLNFHLELPSVKPMSPDHVLVSDGAGRFYLVRIHTHGIGGSEHRGVIELVSWFCPPPPQSSDTEILTDQERESTARKPTLAALAGYSLDDDWPTPCGLLDAKVYEIREASDKVSLVIKLVVHHTLQKQFYSTQPSPYHGTDAKTVFVVSLLTIPWENHGVSGAPGEAPIAKDDDSHDQSSTSQPPAATCVLSNIVHALRGTEIPFYCALDPSGDGYILGSHTVFQPMTQPINSQPTGVRYLEPGSSTMEVDGVDIHSNTNDSKAMTAAPPEILQQPYVWTQTESDVTVCFALPKGTTKHAIQCRFSSTGLTLHVSLLTPAAERTVDPTKWHLPRYDGFPFFDGVRADECFWTIEPRTGLLTLTLEKRHSKTRWTQLFEEGVDSNPVDETLDPGQLAEFRDALAKYTSESLVGASSTTAEGERPAVVYPSLTQDAPEDIDKEGEEIRFAWVQADPEGTPDLVKATTLASAGHDWISEQFPSFEPHVLEGGIEQPFQVPSVCLKHDVDGLVYRFHHVPLASRNGRATTAEVGGSTASTTAINSNHNNAYHNNNNNNNNNGSNLDLRLVHVSTFDALAFVQASKREKKFVMHDPQGRFCVIAETHRNIYVYLHTVDGGQEQDGPHGQKHAKHERQIVIDVAQMVQRSASDHHGHKRVAEDRIEILGCQLIVDGVLVVLLEGTAGVLVLELI
ncbi:hypothetical protein BGZ73_002986 [Actinomortierella ambigua]|nr:hypothetical protein BGZ73_002986 [Actinomortierella ambigua]